jgi:hypothetical protein
MADTGPIPLPGPRDDPDGAYLRRKAAAALAAFEAAMAAPGGGCHICAVFEFHATLRELAGQFTRIAYDEDKADQREDRAYHRGFGDGLAARHPRRPAMPRPRWLRAAD